MDRAQHVPQYRKVMWTQEEDDRLRAAVQHHGTKNWNRVAKSMPGRNGKQCRERWAGMLSPELSKEAWTPQEDALLIQLHNQYGNKWALISSFLPGRSRIGLRNRWSLHVRRHKRGLRGLCDEIPEIEEPKKDTEKEDEAINALMKAWTPDQWEELGSVMPFGNTGNLIDTGLWW